MAKTKTKNYKIPFDLDGNMLSYEPYQYEGQPVRHEMRDIYQFTDLLTFESYWTGRSAIHICLKDQKGKTYNMMMSSFAALLDPKYQHKEGWYATFTFVKKGTSYSIELVP